MAEWNITKLGDICEITRGGSPRPIINYITNQPNGVNWLKIGDVNETDKYFAKSQEKIKPEGIPKTRKVVKGDLILSNSMSFGRAFITLIDGYIHDGWLRLRPDETVINKEYLYYFLTSNLAQNQFKAVATGSVVNNLKSDTVKTLDILLPSLELQKKIISILATIDNKIIENEKINDNLLQQLNTFYTRFFIENDQPRKVCKVDEYFDISIGKTPPRKEQHWFTYNPKDVVWISISDMGKCGTYIDNSSEYLTQEAVDKYNVCVIPDNTIILSFKLTVGRIAITSGLTTTNEAIAHFKTNNKEINPYLYCFLKNYKFQMLGSTSSIATALNSKIIKDIKFIVPNDDELNAFNELAIPILTTIKIKETEVKQLTKLRDSLLTKLMSGEIDVSNLKIE